MSSHLPAFIRRDWLDVGDGHVLHLAQYGNPEGIPLLFLHGGPGGGCAVEDLRLFDRDTFHIFLLDQRGSGRSKPHGELKQNDLLHLLGDIERVRLWLNLQAWCVVGGSFGATLGFIYSCLYPKRVLSQVLWGLFIPNEEGANWLYGNQGAATLFPQDYLEFTALAPFSSKIDTLFKRYRSGFLDPDADTRLEYVRGWLKWELALALPGAELPESGTPLAKSLAEIELHYASQQYFGAYALMREMACGIKAKTVILQGEMDWVCPSVIVEKFLEEFGSVDMKYTLIKGGYHVLANDKMFLEVVYAVQEMANNIRKIDK